MQRLSSLSRCPWTQDDPLLTEYHDYEWGVPCFDDQRLFELLILEGAQAGLSWRTILYKRENFRKAFAGFDPYKIARFTPKKIESLLKDPGIIRNRLKIESTIKNAKTFLMIQEDYQSFSNYLWQFMDGSPKINTWNSMKKVPCHSKISDQLSKDLKKRGCNFVGSTICYSYMQAIGMVNDHLTSCFCHPLNH